MLPVRDDSIKYEKLAGAEKDVLCMVIIDRL